MSHLVFSQAATAALVNSASIALTRVTDLYFHVGKYEYSKSYLDLLGLK